LAASVQTLTGHITDPFDNLFDAIERAYELAAPYSLATITIHLFKGDHYLVRGERLFYTATNVDKNI
jgi:hypothetical protein